MTVTLYDYWRSSASYRVRIALNLAQIAYQAVPVDLLAGEQASAAHLGRNPQGFVPVLMIDGLRLTQSLAITEYLDETRALGLLPSDAPGRAQARQIAHVIAMDTHPICTPSVVAKLTALTGQQEPARTDWMRHFIRRGLLACEALLPRADSPFALGARPSLADICIAPQLYNAERWGVPLGDMPRLSCIALSCAAHPAFSAAAPQAVKDQSPPPPSPS